MEEKKAEPTGLGVLSMKWGPRRKRGNFIGIATDMRVSHPIHKHSLAFF